jgi:hypothetical protein
MRSKLLPVVSLAAAVALTLATSAHAQRSEQSEATTPKAGTAKQQRTRSNSDDARKARAQAPRAPASSEQQSGNNCFIPVDKDNDLGYWGACSTKGARPVK